MKKYLILLFIVVVLVQWYVPAQMMWSRQQVLAKGKVFKFETEPVDPEDPLRGRYVQLAFKADTAAARQTFAPGEKAYAEIETNAAGFAMLKQIYKQPPASKDYIEVKVYYTLYDDKNAQHDVVVTYPFEQFFLDEYKAPKAEELYRNSNRRDTVAGKTYALVSIYKGNGVIKDLIINDRSIYSYFK